MKKEDVQIGDWIYAEKCLDDCREKQFIPLFQVKEISIQSPNVWLRPQRGRCGGVEIKNCRLATEKEIYKILTYEIY